MDPFVFGSETFPLTGKFDTGDKSAAALAHVYFDAMDYVYTDAAGSVVCYAGTRTRLSNSSLCSVVGVASDVLSPKVLAEREYDKGAPQPGSKSLYVCFDGGNKLEKFGNRAASSFHRSGETVSQDTYRLSSNVAATADDRRPGFVALYADGRVIRLSYGFAETPEGKRNGLFPEAKMSLRGDQILIGVAPYADRWQITLADRRDYSKPQTMLVD